MPKNFSYVSVADSLYADFIINKLNIGDVLPTEQDLIEYYKVSRTTIRRGLKKLAKDNLVYTIQGSGTFVKGKKKECQRTTLKGFGGYAKEIEATPKTEVLALNIIEASEEIAEIFRIQKGSLIYKTKRLRYLDDVPDHVEVGFYPILLFPDLSVNVLSNSMYQYIEETKKMIIKNTHLMIEPIPLDPDTAQLLQTQANIPSLCMKSIGFLEDDTVFEYTEIIGNTNKHSLSFDIVRDFHYS